MNEMMSKEIRMTSVEVTEMINQFREMEGNKSELQHKHLMEKLRKELNVLELGQQCFILLSYKDKKGEIRPCYSINKDGLKHLIDMTKSRDRIPLQKAYEFLGGDYTKVVCIDRFETTFFNKLSDTLSALNIELETQFNVLSYRVDGYIADYNLVIEYDEAQHFVEPQKSKDEKREREIIEAIDCQVIRLNYQNTDAFNVGLVISEIIKLKGQVAIIGLVKDKYIA